MAYDGVSRMPLKKIASFLPVVMYIRRLNWLLILTVGFEPSEDQDDRTGVTS